MPPSPPAWAGRDPCTCYSPARPGSRDKRRVRPARPDSGTSVPSHDPPATNKGRPHPRPASILGTEAYGFFSAGVVVVDLAELWVVPPLLQPMAAIIPKISMTLRSFFTGQSS